MRSKGTTALPTALFALAALGLLDAQAQRPSLDDVARGGMQSESAELTEFSAPIYKKQRASMKRMCSTMALDGRAESFSKVLTPLAQSDATCRACGPLGKVFTAACTGSRPPKGIPAASHGRLQREPHTLVTAAASEVFRALAQDRESAFFIQRLVAGLASAPGLSPGAKDYFALLSESARGPFTDLLDNEAVQAQTGRGYLAPINPSERKQILDDLF
jgi:hypothetical protein